ncbi:hypothetical protein C5167_041841 [Papaver somniferum]|nr:hypothetical protein C5167_041841 [Papaver somniferum]
MGINIKPSLYKDYDQKTSNNNTNSASQVFGVEPSLVKADQQITPTSAHTIDHGGKMYYATWILQFFTLVMGNMGFILLGGRALKEVDSEFINDHGGITSTSLLRLQYFIIITGAVYFVFAFMVPTISAMRRWLGISFIFTFTYIGILLVILVKDGKANDSRNYKIRGNQVDKVFNAFGAIASILVCNSMQVCD